MSDENKNINKEEYIDLIQVIKSIWSRKLLFIKVWVVTFILSCIWIFPQPRSYVSSIVMVPEMAGETGGSLSSIASSFGINLGNMETTDAYYPELYPDVISTNEFVVSLLSVPVKTTATEDEPSVESSYKDHLTILAKRNLLTYPFHWCKRKIREITTGKKAAYSSQIDPYHLSREDYMLVEQVKSNISCDVDKKTSVITITVWDQDGQIAADLADTVSRRLQNFIIEYRTHKARTDMEYYTLLCDSTSKLYKEVANQYAAFCDAHQNVILQTVQQERDALENEMSLRLNTMNMMESQLQAAKAKLQERTPAFTILSRPGVGFRPEKPKRLIFVIAMLFLATFGTIGWIFKKEVTQQLKALK